MEREPALVHSARGLEKKVRESDMQKNSCRTVDYVNVVLASAVMKGVLDIDYGKYKEKSYDALLREHHGCVESIDDMKVIVDQKTFRSEHVIDHYLKAQVKQIKRRVSHGNFSSNSLGRRMAHVFQSASSEEELYLTLDCIGEAIRKELNLLENRSGDSGERLSPNFMKEIDAVYKAFVGYQAGSEDGER